jgi:hypothetical protein
MRIKVILMVSYFLQVKVVKMSIQDKDGQFSAHGLFIII